MQTKKILRWIPFVFLILAIVLAFYFKLYNYLSFDALRAHREQLALWTQQHYFLMVLSYMLIYITAVTLSLPGAVFLTLAGGFLFGFIWGILYVVVSATIGATFLFMIVQFSIGDWLAEKAGKWTHKLQDGFHQNAFQYLLILRLIPLFPFWVVNIVPGLLEMRIRTFILGTFLGIIPGSFVYVLVGNGLGQIFDAGKTPNLDIIFKPQVLIPLIALALLSAVPILYKRFWKTAHE